MPRVMDIVTPLGPDVLLFRSLRAQESLGRLFEYAVTVLSTRNDIDPYQLLGKSATVKLELPSGGTRCFDGIVARFALAGSQGRFVRYEMILRPWLWFLTRTADCRIFQEKTVEDIIREVFDPGKYPDAAFEFQLSNSYRTWEYCVQYRETDFNFVSRLMEQEGMYYYFQHVEGRHTMYIVDSPSAHGPYETYANIPFVADVRSGTTERERVSDWYYSCEVQPGSYVIDDYDFKKPYDELLRQTVEVREHEHASHEIFDCPGEYEKPSDGEQYVRVRLEELQSQHERIQGLTNARGLNVGYTFALQLHPRADQNKQYLTTSARINFASQEHEAAGSGGATYSCSFECAPANSQFRTPRETPKPVVQGIQTARVVGPEGKEIYTDEYGRVKVHFHWDRHGPQNERSTCWIRVSQGWAGKTYGMMNVPRIGHEVVVDFVEGDPDQPLITGRVYNADQKVPYELPKYEAYETWRTRSTPGGGVRDFNELRFDDRKDKEQVFIHAQRRMDVRVKRNKYETVQGSSSFLTGGDEYHTIGGDYNFHVKGNGYQKYDGKLDLFVTNNIQIATDNDIRMGSTRLEANARRIVLDGGSELVLRVGGNMIRIDASGVTIVGTLTKINSGGGSAPAPVVATEDPFDAGAADDGTPGYLDELRRRGGGPARGRTTRFTYNGSGLDIGGGNTVRVFRNGDTSNGSVSVGSATTISHSPDDPQFTDKVLDDLGAISSVPAGRTRLNNIENSGRDLTIERIPNGAGATAVADNDADSAAPGQPSFNSGNGTNGTGTGAGSGSTVRYNPDFEPSITGPDPANPLNPPQTLPSDDVLYHEMGHSDRGMHGQQDATPIPAEGDGRQFDNVEERVVTQDENTYRDQRGIPQRRDHHSL